MWKLNDFSDEFIESCQNLLVTSSAPATKLRVVGYLATVDLPSALKVRGAAGDERATVDLFVNGRLREKNLLRHFPTQRIVESYLFGQIHFDEMDGDGDTPFTSSREGVVETNDHYMALCDYMKKEFLPRVIDEWDKFRLDRGKAGDDENPRKSKKARSASNLVAAAEEEYAPENAPKQSQDLVDFWLNDLKADAEFNVSAYVDCFLSENLVRKFIVHSKKGLTPIALADATKHKTSEELRKRQASIGFEIRRENTDLSYLDLDQLAYCAEGPKPGNPAPSLHNDAVTYKPIRNAVGHTGLLSKTAKNLLGVTFENIRARVKALLATIV